MKSFTTFLLGCFLACGASAETRFNAYMVTRDQPLFIIEVDGRGSDWIPLSGEFHGWHISAFDPKTEILTVDYQGTAHALALKSAKVTSAPVDSNEPLRTLKGLPLAYEVARRGDENTRGILIRYQQALSGASIDKAHQDAMERLRLMVERIATNGAQRMLARPANKTLDRTGPGTPPPAGEAPRH